MPAVDHDRAVRALYTVPPSPDERVVATIAGYFRSPSMAWRRRVGGGAVVLAFVIFYQSAYIEAKLHRICDASSATRSAHAATACRPTSTRRALVKPMASLGI